MNALSLTVVILICLSKKREVFEMVKSKKQLSLIVTLVLTLGIMFGCSAAKTNQDKGKAEEDGDEIVELTFAWWGSQIRHDRTQQEIDLFEEQNPNIKIRGEFSGCMDIGKKSGYSRSWTKFVRPCPNELCIFSRIGMIADLWLIFHSMKIVEY